MSSLPPNQFSSMIVNTFNDPDFSDCEIHVADKVFHVNKMILKLHSEVFLACFRHNSVESQTNKIHIEDADADMVEAMLKFMYSADVEELDSKAFELFKLSDRYNVVGLKNLCANNMCSNLSVGTVFNCLRVAYQVNNEELKNKCICFVADNPGQVMEQPEWNELTNQEPLIYADLCQHLIACVEQAKQGPIGLEAANAYEETEPVITRTKEICRDLERFVEQFESDAPDENQQEDIQYSVSIAYRKRQQADLTRSIESVKFRTNFLNNSLDKIDQMHQKLVNYLSNHRRDYVSRRQIAEQMTRIRETITKVQNSMYSGIHHLSNVAVPISSRRRPRDVTPPSPAHRQQPFPLWFNDDDEPPRHRPRFNFQEPAVELREPFYAFRGPLDQNPGPSNQAPVVQNQPIQYFALDSDSD
ncbi:Speckle-type POZ protein B [Aphelenchoides bicaudatus]|nr:Speckle-type POZ protein B [Aphelenchoides bicaudatus]